MKQHYFRFLFFSSLFISNLSFGQNAPTVHLQSGDFTLNAQIGMETLNDEVVTWPEFNGYRYGVISLEHYPTQDQWEALKEQGIIKLEYLPKHCFSIAISNNAQLNELMSFGSIWVLPYSADFKTDISIDDIPARAKSDGRVIINAHTFDNADTKEIWPVVAELDAELLEVESKLKYITVAISPDLMDSVLSLSCVKWVDWKYDAGVPENYTGRTSHRINYISNDNTNGIGYDGSGIVVALQDDGSIGPHIDHEGRILEQFWQTSLGDHGDHVGGTINGAGNLNPYHEGQAKGSDLYVYKAAPEYQAFDSMDIHYYSKDVVITSTSYSNGCNAGYTALARQMDQQVYDMEHLVHVFSAGNSGTSNCGYGAGNTWGNITGGHKIGKNVITVANLTENDIVATSSSRGPSEDGRIKPDISAKGTAVTSTLDGNTYGVKTGTSMSCPGVSGTLAVLYEAFEDQQGDLPPSGLMKAIVLNTAEDLGNTGPDYIYGWGRINARRAYEVIESNNFTSGTITNGDSTQFTLIVPPGMHRARFMLYWTDPEASVNASTALINDLDLTVTDPNSNENLPYLLNPAPNTSTLNAPAVPGVDDLNNMEQVEFFAPDGGNYLIKVKGSDVPQGPQDFFVVYWYEAEELTLTYPVGGESLVPFTSEKIRWDAPYASGSMSIEYSSDGGNNWNTITSGANVSLGYHNWTVPNLATGNVRLRLTYGSEVVESENFSVIRTPTNLTVDYSCPDSIGLSWNSASNATGYTVYTLGEKYMEPIGTSAESEFVDYISNPQSDKLWYSVSSLGDNNAQGKRLFAVQKSPGIFNCVINDDAGISEVLPEPGTFFSCHGDSLEISFTVVNEGLNPITAIDANFSTSAGQTNSETFVQAIAASGSHTFTFNTKAALSNGLNNIEIIVDAQNDVNPYNDTIRAVYPFDDSEILSVLWSEDFDSFNDCGTDSDCGLTECTMENDWVNEPNGIIDESDWRTNSGDTPSDFTGPDDDHTQGNSSGNYVYIEASGECNYSNAMLTSPCIDLTQAVDPELTFWYHMYGFDMGELHVDLFDGTQWIEDIFEESGNQGEDWELAEVSLAPYVGNFVNLRFRGITGNDYRSDIAIDDIQLTHPPIANFTYGVQTDGFTINFEDLSLYSDSMSFELGEGTIMDSVPSSFTYPNQITYTVTQIVSNPIGQDTMIQLITTLGDAPFNESESIQVYPNPASQYINVFNIEEYKQLQLFDAQGVLIKSEAIENRTNVRLSLDELGAGMYLLKVDNSAPVVLSIVK